jgi:hypothetical protein
MHERAKRGDFKQKTSYLEEFIAKLQKKNIQEV